MTSQVSDHWPSWGYFFLLFFSLVSAPREWLEFSQRCNYDTLFHAIAPCPLVFLLLFSLSRLPMCTRKHTIARNLCQWITDLTYCFCKDNHRPHWCQRKPNKWTFRSLTVYRKMLFTGLCTFTFSFTYTHTVKRQVKHSVSDRIKNKLQIRLNSLHVVRNNVNREEKNHSTVCLL